MVGYCRQCAIGVKAEGGGGAIDVETVKRHFVLYHGSKDPTGLWTTHEAAIMQMLVDEKLLAPPVWQLLVKKSDGASRASLIMDGVPADITVLGLKRRIEAHRQGHVAVEDQRLTFAGETLEDAESLARGGGPAPRRCGRFTG